MKEYIQEGLALAYGIICAPKETLSVIVTEQRLGEGIAIWILSVLLSVVSVWAQWNDASVWTAAAIYGGTAFFLGCRILLIHGSARLLGHRGSIKSLTAAICFSEIPLNLATLFGSLIFVVPGLVVHIVSLAAGIWTFVLDVMAIKANYNASTGHGVAILLLSVAIIIVAALILALYAIFTVVSLFY